MLQNRKVNYSDDKSQSLGPISSQIHPNIGTYVGVVVITTVVLKSSVFWDITPCSPLKVNRCFGGACRWFFAWLILSTLKMEATCSSETSVELQRTIRRCIPEDRTLCWNVYLQQDAERHRHNTDASNRYADRTWAGSCAVLTIWMINSFCMKI
jgi:hypothetical protein